MANTFNFGSGKWAAKEGSVLAYNNENNNFKPLPFTFTRASTATRVNESGLIESVASGVPRIDFLDNADGHLLLEPSRTNLFLRSEEFDNASWIKNNSSISANSVVSPDGSTNADSLIENTANASHNIYQSVSITSGTTYTISFFVKANGRTRFRIGDNYGRLPLNVFFDLSTVTVVSGTGSISDYGNGWYRCTVSSTATATAAELLYIILVNSGTTTTYTGDGTSGLYLWGAQLEAGSYATSYIPTSGAAVTRAADFASQTPPSGIIGQTEGTFFLDFSSLSDSISNEQVSLSDGTDANTIKFVLGSVVTGVQAEGRVSSVSQFSIKKTTSDYDSLKKIAVAYKANDFVFYYNGEQVGIDSSGNIPSISQIKFSTGAGTSPLYGKINGVQLYNTRLSNSELAALTS